MRVSSCRRGRCRPAPFQPPVRLLLVFFGRAEVRPKAIIKSLFSCSQSPLLVEEGAVRLGGLKFHRNILQAENKAIQRVLFVRSLVGGRWRPWVQGYRRADLSPLLSTRVRARSSSDRRRRADHSPSPDRSLHYPSTEICSSAPGALKLCIGSSR